MIGEFGLVAWPARYGDAGVMTFMVNHDGVVYEKFHRRPPNLRWPSAASTLM
jgi:hypothetical protein